MKVMHVLRPGQVPYDRAWEWQKELVEARGRGEIPDTLILLQHPHTYTFGRSGKREHLVWDEAQLQQRKVAVHWVDRGGDITYHGPGQLVGYPILDLSALGRDYVGYLRSLEESLIRTLAQFGISAYRVPGYTGVWLRDPGTQAEEKIAAIGVKANVQGITSHGFALNVNADLAYFAGIIPCGINDKGVTSLQKVLGREVELEQVADEYVEQFRQVFGYDAARSGDSRLSEAYPSADNERMNG